MPAVPVSTATAHVQRINPAGIRDPRRRACLRAVNRGYSSCGLHVSPPQGEGSLAVLAREPGVGKTILCVPVVANVGRQHGQTLLSHGYELCLPSPAYEPFLEAPRGCLVRPNAGALQQALRGAPDVVRMLPELGERGQKQAQSWKARVQSRAQVAVWAVRHDPAGQAMGDPDERLGLAP